MVVGITGGLAAGKSLVTRMLQARGAITFSADEAARAVLTPGGAAMNAIAGAFGREMLSPNGELDRERLGQFIFSNAAARDQLNRILHPAIRRLLRAQIEASRKDFSPAAIVVVEVPLLYESNLSDWFERIVVVTASETTQIVRLKERSGLDEAEARKRIAAQWPLAEKAARADWVIVNDNSLENVQVSVDKLWNYLIQAA